MVETWGGSERPVQPASPAPADRVGRPARLRDGTVVLVRPISSSDKQLLAGAFARLSEESRRRRFFGPKQGLTASELAYLTEVDHRDHEALIALDPRSGEAVGVARYVRWRDQPELAEPAVAVVDDWQRRGVATALLNALSRRARAQGVRRFRAHVLPDNGRALKLFRDLGASASRSADPDSVQVDVELPADEQGMGAQLASALRVAAARYVAFRIPGLGPI